MGLVRVKVFGRGWKREEFRFMSFILIYIVNIKIYVYIKGNYIYRVFYKCYLIIIKVL